MKRRPKTTSGSQDALPSMASTSSTPREDGSEPPPSERPTDPPAADSASPADSRRPFENDDHGTLSSRSGEDGRSRHAADPVYEKLALAILDGSLAPGSPMPSERALSERFGVSRLIVRQALHRLADMGLLRVRQGGPSVIVHPNEAKDLRIVDLIYRLGPRGARDVRELVERRLLSRHALLFLAAKRASAERRIEIARMAESYAARGAPTDEQDAFDKRFFEALAEATDNRSYVLETGWWFRIVHGRDMPSLLLASEQRVEFYHELARRLADDKDAARYYLETLAPMLDTMGALSLGY